MYVPGERSRDCEGQRRNAGDGGQEAIAQAKWQRTEADGREVQDALSAHDLGQGHETWILADHSLNKITQNSSAGDKGAQAAERARTSSNGPAPGEAPDEAGHRGRSGVTDDGGKRRDKDHGKVDEPSAGQLAPLLSDGSEPVEELLGVDEGEDAEDAENEGGKGQQRLLEQR